jgi:hypothetical protein
VTASSPGFDAVSADQPVRASPDRRRRLIAQARFATTLILVLAAVIAWARAGFLTPPNTIAAGPLPLILAIGAALAYASVGLLLALRRPEVRIGAIEAWVGVLLGLLTLAWGVLAMESQIASTATFGAWIALLAAVLVTPSIAALAVNLVLLYPTDHLLAPKWRVAVWLSGIGVVIAAVGRLLRPGPLTFVGDYQNPVGVTALGTLPALIQLCGYLLLGVAAVMAVTSLALRYVRSPAVERAQLRIFAALTVVGTIAFVAFVLMAAVPNLDPQVRDTIVMINILVAALGPFAITVAIARYRLWEIDRLVERTFVYGALTAILAGLYAATIRLLEALFVGVTGQSSDAALIIATLVLATTFTPVKNRLERLAGSWTKERAKAVGAERVAVTAETPLTGTAAGEAALATNDELVALIDARIRAVLDERSKSGKDHKGGDS